MHLESSPKDLHLLLVLLILPVFWALSCTDDNENGDPVITYAKPSDFKDSTNVSVQLAEGFNLSLWAPGPLLTNAVAISFDNQGAAYVSETHRRKSSDFDIRDHRDWMIEDLALQNLEATKEFHLKKLATENSQQNLWLEDFNADSVRDWRDLTVQTEYIRKIWDSDGDGKADTSSKFAEDINEMLTGVAAGIMHYDQEVYLTAAPNVYRFRDKDGDGDADYREIISHGYGIHIAYAGHDMSGLTIGPDGKIYWSIGDIGVSVANKEGLRFEYPHEGAVMRCNPDGSDFEVYAHGLRNPQELAFDAYGNLISVDNDGDHPGEHERFVHILEGSDSGWRINWQFGKYNNKNEQYKVWMDEALHLPHFPGQAAYLLPPLGSAPDGPAGLVFQPGTALNDYWQNFFFGSYFKGSAARSQIQAFRLEPKGASFKIAETRNILTGIVSTGLAIGPDGGLYINDWLEGYAKKPAGRIWRLDVVNKDQEKRNQTAKLLKEGMSQKSVSQLKELLKYSDMRVRMNAQFELVTRNERQALITVLQDQSDELAQIHAIWGIGQLGRIDPNHCEVLVPFLKHANPELSAQTAKVIGDARYSKAADELIEVLNSKSMRVVYFAAEALGKIQEKSAFQPLIELIQQTKDSDPHLRHGLIYAVSKLNMEAELIELHNHSAPSVRLAAVVALRNMRSAGLSSFLSDQDSLVSMETARAIHDDESVEAALADLAKVLLTTEVHNEAFIRRAINANLRIGDSRSANRLAQYAKLEKAPTKMRTDALWSLGYWPNPPELDRVEGRYRKLANHQEEAARTAFSNYLVELLSSEDIVLRTAAVELAGRIRYQEAEAKLISYCQQKTQPLAVRRASLQSLADLNSSSIIEVLETSLSDDHLELRTDAQTLLGKLDLSPEVVVAMLSKILASATIKEKQKALGSLAKINDPAADLLLQEWVGSFLIEEVEPELELDVIMAVETSSFGALKEKLAVYEEKRTNASTSDRYKETLYGGNATKGRQLFFRNNSAQCIRCHQLQGFGGEVGPGLDGIGNRLDRKKLLESMIAPSVRIAPGYGTISLEMKDGTKVIGILQEDSKETVTIKTADGINKSFDSSGIKSKNYMPSAMPSMVEVLTKEEVRDLLTFLVELN